MPTFFSIELCWLTLAIVNQRVTFQSFSISSDLRFASYLHVLNFLITKIRLNELLRISNDLIQHIREGIWIIAQRCQDINPFWQVKKMDSNPLRFELWLSWNSITEKSEHFPGFSLVFWTKPKLPSRNTHFPSFLW